ncbi:hypothetical protein FKM82_029392 [Ascaphus truei]
MISSNPSGKILANSAASSKGSDNCPPGKSKSWLPSAVGFPSCPRPPLISRKARFGPSTALGPGARVGACEVAGTSGTGARRLPEVSLWWGAEEGQKGVGPSCPGGPLPPQQLTSDLATPWSTVRLEFLCPPSVPRVRCGFVP